MTAVSPNPHPQLSLCCFFLSSMGYFFQLGRQGECVSQVKWGGKGWSYGTDISKEPFVLRHIIPGIQSSAPKPNQAFQTAQKPVMQASWALSFFFFFLRLYRVHWIIWLGLFNRVTFGFSMAQMELIINYLDALIKKKTTTSLWIYEGLLGDKDKGTYSAFFIWMRGRVGKVLKGRL